MFLLLLHSLQKGVFLTFWKYWHKGAGKLFPVSVLSQTLMWKSLAYEIMGRNMLLMRLQNIITSNLRLFCGCFMLTHGVGHTSDLLFCTYLNTGSVVKKPVMVRQLPFRGVQISLLHCPFWGDRPDRLVFPQVFMEPVGFQTLGSMLPDLHWPGITHTGIQVFSHHCSGTDSSGILGNWGRLSSSVGSWSASNSWPMLKPADQSFFKGLWCGCCGSKNAFPLHYHCICQCCLVELLRVVNGLVNLVCLCPEQTEVDLGCDKFADYFADQIAHIHHGLGTITFATESEFRVVMFIRTVLNHYNSLIWKMCLEGWGQSGVTWTKGNHMWTGPLPNLVCKSQLGETGATAGRGCQGFLLGRASYWILFKSVIVQALLKKPSLGADSSSSYHPFQPFSFVESCWTCSAWYSRHIWMPLVSWTLASLVLSWI